MQGSFPDALSASLIGTDLHEHLPDVLPAKKTEERMRRVLDPLDDRLAILEAPVAHPLARLAGELAEAVEVVADDVALESQPLRDDHEHVSRPG